MSLYELKTGFAVKETTIICMHVHVYTFVHLQGSDFVFECVHNHSTNNVGGDVMVQQSLNLATDNKNVRMSRVSLYIIIIAEMWT